MATPRPSSTLQFRLDCREGSASSRKLYRDIVRVASAQGSEINPLGFMVVSVRVSKPAAPKAAAKSAGARKTAAKRSATKKK